MSVTSSPIKPIAGEQYSRSSTVYITTIPAGGTLGVDAYGQRFYFINATAPLEAKTNLSAYKPYRKGTGENFTDEFRFNRIEFHNPNTYPIFIQVFIGFGDYLDTTSELVESFTQAVGQASTTIAALSTVVLNGNPSNTQIQRKAVVISNLSTTDALYVRDISHNNICAVLPNTSIMLPISAYVEIYNGTASAIPWCCSEIWYTYLP